MIYTNKICIIFVIFVLLLPISYSNGGCIKIADDIFVQLSSAPIVPVVEKSESFLISFGNKNGLINEQITGKLKIVKNGDVILMKDFKIQDGVLDLKYTFENPGLYEIFLEFGIKNKTYMPEDFLVEVKEKNQDNSTKIIFFVIGILIGAFLMFIIKNKNQKILYKRK